MTSVTFIDALKSMDTKSILAALGDMNIGDLIHNPWFLGTMGVLALIALLCKWRALLALIVGLTGLSWLISYTVRGGAELQGLSNTNLFVFAAGGIVIIFVVIYLLFIRHD